jgi:3-oxoacyl-[acyl-carrier-protein] synthase III
MNGIRIAGTGSYLPGAPLDRDALRAFLRRHPDTLSESFQERLLEQSGIETRHLAIDPRDESRRESNTSMAAEAARRALAAAGWTPDDVDLLVVTTVVPDQLMPATSTLVQDALGISRCAEIEISANCSAPTKGLMVAASELRLGNYQRALVCSSQFASFGFVPPWANPALMSASQSHLRWILSDGAAALALERGEPDIDLRVRLDSRGLGKRSGMSLALGAAYPDLRGAFASGAHHVTQDLRYVLKQGIRLVLDGLEEMLRMLELPGASIDHFIPSVSSMQVARKLQPVTARLGIRPEAWRMNFTRVGYVGSVAVPIMLDELVRTDALHPGDVICTVAEESSKWIFAGTVFRWNP